MFRLPKLPFEPDELSPYISEQTIDAHYNHHHRHYVEKLNVLISGSIVADWPLNDLIKYGAVLREQPTYDLDWQSIYNNARQHFNHSMYWQFLGPAGTRPERFPTDDFIEIATNHFGDGWIAVDPDLRPFAVLDTDFVPNDTVLLIDVWEHAYYLDVKWDRRKYVENFLEVVDWEEVTKRVTRFRPNPSDG